MSLFDRFRTRPPELPEHYVELVRRTGRIEAEVERLSLVWESYKDELKRLVNRLEKRDQRAERTEQRELEVEAGGSELDAVSARILRRRRHVNGVQAPGGSRAG